MTVWVPTILLASQASWAARGQLAIDTGRIATGQSTRVQLLLVDGRPDKPPKLSVPKGLSAFFAGSRQTYRTTGFEISHIYSYEYTVEALAPGEYVIGPIEVSLPDEVVTTGTVALSVLRREDVFVGEGVEVRAWFEPTLAWEGQLLVYRYESRARAKVAHVNWRLPEFEGLRAPQYGLPEERTFSIGDDRGTISVSEGTVPLLASGTGERTIGVALATVEIHAGSEDAFGFTPRRREVLATEPIALTVRPLPPPPEGFSGLVGEYVFRSRVDSQTAAVGDSLTWTLEVAGEGATEGLLLPVPTGVVGAEVYEGAREATGRVEDSVYLGVASTDWVLVPTVEGLLELPDVEVVSFSTARGRYVTESVASPTVAVQPGAGVDAALVSFAPEQAETVPEAPTIEMRPHYRWGLARVAPFAPWAGWMALLAGAPGLVAAVLELMATARRRRTLERAGWVRVVRPSAQLKVLPDDREARLTLLDVAMGRALALASGQPLDGRLDRSTAILGLPAELAPRVVQVTARLDRARFAGQPDGLLVQDIRELVTALEAL